MLSVFYAKIPDRQIDKTGNIIRDEEIFSTSNEKVKKQKFFVWKLLLKSLESLGYSVDKIKFFKGENGRWSSNEVDFSLSHSENLVAVAISILPVGVDIEKCKTINEKLAHKILTDCEMHEFLSLEKGKKSDYLMQKWTQKESIFKQSNQTVCRYKELITSSQNLTTKKIEIEGDIYLISVCHQEKTEPKILQVEL